MWAPKSRTPKKPPRKREKRKHLNKKFYNSAAWRATRKSYIREYQTKIYSEVTNGYWTIRGGTKLELSPHQQTVILSYGIPCEICLKLYCAKTYDKMEPGKELDHIEPLNPENALESTDHGNPFDHDNLQLLCYRHHAKKSQRETT